MDGDGGSQRQSWVFGQGQKLTSPGSVHMLCRMRPGTAQRLHFWGLLCLALVALAAADPAPASELIDLEGKRELQALWVFFISSSALLSQAGTGLGGRELHACQSA